MVGLIQFRDFKPRGEGAARCRESSLRESPPPSRAMNLMEDKLLGEAEVPLNLVGLRTKLFMEFNLGRNSALALQGLGFPLPKLKFTRTPFYPAEHNSRSPSSLLLLRDHLQQ